MALRAGHLVAAVSGGALGADSRRALLTRVVLDELAQAGGDHMQARVAFEGAAPLLLPGLTIRQNIQLGGAGGWPPREALAWCVRPAPQQSEITAPSTFLPPNKPGHCCCLCDAASSCCCCCCCWFPRCPSTMRLITCYACLLPPIQVRRMRREGRAPPRLQPPPAGGPHHRR